MRIAGVGPAVAPVLQPSGAYAAAADASVADEAPPRYGERSHEGDHPQDRPKGRLLDDAGQGCRDILRLGDCGRLGGLAALDGEDVRDQEYSPATIAMRVRAALPSDLGYPLGSLGR